MSQLPPAGAGLCMPEGRPGRRQAWGRAGGQGDQGQGWQGSDHGHRLADVLVRCGIPGHQTQEALWVRRDGARGRHRNPGRSSRCHRRGADQARLAGEEIGRLRCGGRFQPLRCPSCAATAMRSRHRATVRKPCISAGVEAIRRPASASNAGLFAGSVNAEA
jgi:hypothetical protein